MKAQINKDGRLQIIKAISERHKCQLEIVRLKKLVIKMACCGNCRKPCKKGKVCKEWELKV